MEFSEDFELKTLTKSSKLSIKIETPTKLLSSKQRKSKFQSCPFTSQSQDFSQNPDHNSRLLIQKDLSYLKPQSHNPRSSLTLSLIHPVESVNLSETSLLIKIYFFHSSHYIDLVLPYEIKVVDMLSKALLAYIDRFKSSLPYGLDTTAYRVWLPCEDSYKPDTDFVINKDLQVFKLGCSSLCICENLDFNGDRLKKGNIGIRNLENLDKIVIKVVFEGNWANFLVGKDTCLRDMLGSIQKKFGIDGWIVDELYEFRSFIEETGEYCAVHVDLGVKDLRGHEVWMGRKEYLDYSLSSYNFVKFNKY